MEEGETRTQREAEAIMNSADTLFRTLKSTLEEHGSIKCAPEDSKKAPQVQVLSDANEKLIRIFGIFRPHNYCSSLPDTDEIVKIVREKTLGIAKKELENNRNKLNNAMETQQIRTKLQEWLIKWLHMQTTKMREEHRSDLIDSATFAVEVKKCEILIEFLESNLDLNLPKPS